MERNNEDGMGPWGIIPQVYLPRRDPADAGFLKGMGEY